MAFSHREPFLLQGYSVVTKLYHLAYISESTLGENEQFVRGDRHARVDVLFFDPAPKRLFGIWAMAYAGYEVQARFDIRGVRSVTQLNAEHMGQNMIETLERMVLERQTNLGHTATLHV